MELTERVHKLEIGHADHEVRLRKVEKENEEAKKNEQTFHDYIVATEAQAKGRDKTLKVMLTVLTTLSAISTLATVLTNIFR